MHQPEEDCLQQDASDSSQLSAETFAQESPVQDFFRHAVGDEVLNESRDDGGGADAREGVGGYCRAVLNVSEGVGSTSRVKSKL